MHLVGFNIRINHDTRAPLRHILKVNSHIACLAHAVTLPCRAAKGLDCVSPIGFIQRDRV